MPLPRLARAFVADHARFASYLRMQDILSATALSDEEHDWFDNAFDRSDALTVFARTRDSDRAHDWWCPWQGDGAHEPAVVLVYQDREISLVAPSFEAFVSLLGSGGHVLFPDLDLEQSARATGTYDPAWRTGHAMLVAWAAGKGIQPAKDPGAIRLEATAVDDALTAWWEQSTPW